MRWKMLCCHIPLLLIMGCAMGNLQRKVFKGELFLEPSVYRADLSGRRVAIVPNRLPLNLQDPEKWRRFNWGIINQEFGKNGFEIIDYQTSVQAFERSGLPLEDTRNSRDKYAELAEQLAVDYIVVPYYGTFMESKTFFTMSTLTWQTATTLQIYSAAQNDFFARVDAPGWHMYISGASLIAMVEGFLLGLIPDSENSAVSNKQVGSFIGMIGAIYFTIADLIYIGMVPDDVKYQKAFSRAIKYGLEPFFKALPK